MTIRVDTTGFIPRRNTNARSIRHRPHDQPGMSGAATRTRRATCHRGMTIRIACDVRLCDGPLLEVGENVGGRVGAPVRADLAIGIEEMALDGADAEVKAIRDLLVR